MSDETKELVVTQIKELVVPNIDVEPFLAPLKPFRAQILAAIESAKGISIKGDVDGEKAGYAKAKTLWSTLRDLRTKGVEAARVATKRPVLDVGGAIDGLANECKALIEPEEKRLKEEIDAYDKAIEEEKAKKAKADADRVAERLRLAWERMGAKPVDLDFKLARDGSDLAWCEHLLTVEKRLERERMIRDREEALKALGASIPMDLADWTQDQFDSALCEAVDAHKRKQEQDEENQRAEEKRLADERRAEETRRENVRRFDLLSALGVIISMEAVASLLPEEFDVALAEAKRLKELADKKAKDDADELRELRRRQDLQEAEAKRAADALAAKERAAAIAPDREKLARWTKEVRAAIESCPALLDKEMARMASTAVRNLFSVLDDLGEAVDAEAPQTAGAIEEPEESLEDLM